MLFQAKNSINQWVTRFDGIEITIKREDLLHPHVSGNKFRKLNHNLTLAKQKGAEVLLTFGGPYSNHLSATAAAGKIMGFKTVGYVRGEKERSENPTLKFCRAQGMELFPISRTEYRQKHTSQYLEELREKWGSFYHLPEGGTNALAIKGCSEILTEEDKEFDVICSSVGTGGTLAGIIESTNVNQKVLGFAALKHLGLQEEIKKYTQRDNWELNHDFTHGGYAKISKQLIDFINTFNKNFKIPLDPVYTGKMLFGIFELIKNKQWKWGNNILVIHTGGLQGIAGMNQQLIKKGWLEITQ